MDSFVVTFALALGSGRCAGQAQAPARNVVVITIDGLRWQEFFGGAAREYFKQEKDGGPGATEKRFWRPTPDERRAALMPFVWSTIAPNGQIFGDPSRRAATPRLTNGLWFSYPGYNEMFAGAADPRVDSNDKVPNPNVTVLEWLNRRPGFEGRVAAFGSWDVLPFILNRRAAGFRSALASRPCRSRRPIASARSTSWPPTCRATGTTGPFDAPIVYAALETLRTDKPRVLYIMLGEGDEWAHAGRYDLYLDATFRADRFIERVWDTLQSIPEYAESDDAARDDRSRTRRDDDRLDRSRPRRAGGGVDVDVRARARRARRSACAKSVTVTTSQLAATIAAVVGEDFKSRRRRPPRHRCRSRNERLCAAHAQRAADPGFPLFPAAGDRDRRSTNEGAWVRRAGPRPASST